MARLNNCGFTPTAGGTGNWTVSAGLGGYQLPVAANVVSGSPYTVMARDTSGNWELSTGVCTVSAGVATFARTTVLQNSAGTGTQTPGQTGAGTLINFASVPSVFVVETKESILSVDEANAFTAAQQQQGRYNVGINQTTALAASQNFNAVMSAGTYYSVDNTPTNAPSSGYWYLFVESYGLNPTNYVCQTATRLDVAGAATYTRTYVGGTWGSWLLQIVGGPSAAYTPTCALVGGTGGVSASPSVRYFVAGTITYLYGTIAISSSGTANSPMSITLPSTPAYGFGGVTGRENNLTGKQIIGAVVSGKMNLINYDNAAGPATSGASISLFGFYE